MRGYWRILCPVDGTELSDKALEQAAYVARVSGARLLLLHVVEKWYRSSPNVTDSEEWTEIHTKWLEDGKNLVNEQLRKLDEKDRDQAKTILREGDAAHEIVATALEERADLIVMASNRYSPADKLFWGSVTDRVTKRAPCPVLWVFK